MTFIYSDSIPYGATGVTYSGDAAGVVSPPAVTYRYLFVNILTGAIKAEVPLTGVDFTQSLNAAGTLNAHIMISNVQSNLSGFLSYSNPTQYAIYVDRNGVIIWGGVIWMRSYNSKTQTLTFTAREWLSYFEKRVIASTTVFNAQDQLFVAQQLITNTKSIFNGDVGLLSNVDPLSTVTSGVSVTQTYFSYELKPVFTAIQELSRQSGGFDFAVDCYYDGGGNIAKSFNTYYPRRGIAYSSSKASAPVFEFPAGNVVEYTYPEDGSVVGNVTYVQGAGSNEGKLVANSSSGLTQYPAYEYVASYNNVTDPVVLANLATGLNKALKLPAVTITMLVNPNLDPVLGSYRVGDDVRVRIRDPRIAGLDATYRIVAIKVQAGEKSPERVTLTLAEAGTSV